MTKNFETNPTVYDIITIMIIPEKIKIGGHWFSIDSSKELDRDLGNTNYETSTIKISSTLSGTIKESTFIHEILHVINTTMDHTLLDSLAEQIYQVLSDNDMLK